MRASQRKYGLASLTSVASRVRAAIANSRGPSRYDLVVLSRATSPASASVASARETTALSRPVSSAIRFTPSPPPANASGPLSSSSSSTSRPSPEEFRGGPGPSVVSHGRSV